MDATRDAAAEARARRRFAMVNAHEIVQLACAVAALPDLQSLAEQARAAERAAAGLRGPRDTRRSVPAARMERPDLPHRLRVELAKHAGGDPAVLLDALRLILSPALIERAVLAGAARDLHRRQSDLVPDMLRRRFNRRDGLPEDHVDED